VDEWSVLKIINIQSGTYNFYSKFYERSAFSKVKDKNLEKHIGKYIKK
jgi:hypothetical protein